MPYAISRLTDGEYPGAVRSVNPGDPLQSGEVMVEDKPEDQSYPHQWVWNAATASLRLPNDTDRLRWARRRKKKELEEMAEQAMSGVMPVFRALILLARNSTDPRFTTLKNLDDKLTTKVAQVESESKRTVEEVEAVRWDA